MKKLYDITLTIQQTGCDCLSDAIGYLQEYCGGIVWDEIEEIDQALPKYARLIGTFYNIKVYYDFSTETFCFEDCN